MIAIVASLTPLPNLSIAAASDLTVVEASIGLDLVAVVAAFMACDARLQVVARNPVAATRSLATVGARIDIDLIAVIADFLAFEMMPVTASR